MATNIFVSITIISSQNFCERLKQSILYLSKKLYRNEITLKLAENVADILYSEMPDIPTDYVAVVVDTTVPNAVEKFKRDVSLIDPLIMASRMCIVNGSCRDGTVESAKDIIAFADQLGIPYFNGQIMDNISCRTTAERILKLALYSSGYDTGLPGIVPTPKDLDLFT